MNLQVKIPCSILLNLFFSVHQLLAANASTRINSHQSLEKVKGGRVFNITSTTGGRHHIRQENRQLTLLYIHLLLPRPSAETTALIPLDRELSVSFLIESLELNKTLLFHPTLTHVVIRPSKSDYSMFTNLERIYSVLDQFIAPRSWWSVDYQPYKWLLYSATNSSNKLGVEAESAKSFLVDLDEIVLRRAPLSLLRHFFALSNKDFPAGSDCSGRPLLVSNHDGDAWGNRISNVHSEYENYPEAVFSIYSTTHGDPNGDVIFTEGSICPTMVNKWECLFLPTTNCTLPKSLVDCRTRSCIPRPWGSQFFSSASHDGRMIAESEEVAFVDSMRKNSSAARLTAKAAQLRSEPFIARRSTQPLTQISRNVTVTYSAETPPYVSFVAGVMLRFNAEFRSRIARRIFEFRRSTAPLFTQRSACVSAHVRLDDRRIQGVPDMVKWCKRCLGFNGNRDRIYNSSLPRCPEKEHGLWQDMGCHCNVPFGVVDLDHVINASRVMFPKTRNLFIMTDDSAWLANATRKYRDSFGLDSSAFSTADGSGVGINTDSVAIINGMRSSNNNSSGSGGSSGIKRRFYYGTSHDKKMNIFAFPAGPKHRSSSASASVDFWASVKVAAQCQGFVAHFSSAATRRVFDYMCYRNGPDYGKYLKCPPAYDLGAQNLR